MLDRKFLNGVIDLHIHAGPSVAKRKVDVYEMLTQAEEAGYAGFLVKDHYVPSAHGCTAIAAHFAGSCRVFSSIAMNNSNGGFNLMALDTAYQMGTRMAYMPTVSSRLHIDSHKGKHFHGSGGMTIEEKPIYCLTESGKLLPEILEALDYLGVHPDFALSTGHLTPAELEALIPEAFARGVKKLVINHPHFTVNASTEQLLRWSAMGAYVEITAMEHGMVLEDNDALFNSIDLTRRMLSAGIPMERILISSDFGQNVSPYPVEGLYKFLNLLYTIQGFTEAELAVMVKSNPGKIMGLSE